MTSAAVRSIKTRDKPNDVVFTPKSIVKYMINLNKADVAPDAKILDPCRGTNKIFYNELIKIYNDVDYCEILEDKDFLNYKKKIDYIIGNPPYSLLDQFLDQCLKLSNNICLFICNNHLTPPRVQKIIDNGFYIKNITYCKIDYVFFPNIVITLQKKNKGDHGLTQVYNIREPIFCDVCNSRCARGRTQGQRKYGLNECSKLTE